MSMIKKLRLKMGLSQEEMAKRLDISTNAYRNYESGLRLLPTDVLMRFLQMRGEPHDIELVKILEEVCAIRKQR